MWQEDEEEDVRSYWMTLRTGKDTLIWRRRLWIALCGGIVLEEALDLSSDRLLNNNNNAELCGDLLGCWLGTGIAWGSILGFGQTSLRSTAVMAWCLRARTVILQLKLCCTDIVVHSKCAYVVILSKILFGERCFCSFQSFVTRLYGYNI